MRILLVTQYFLPQPLANAETVGGVAHALSDRGHEVHVVAPVAGMASAANLHVHCALGYFPTDRSSVSRRIFEYLAFSIGALIGALRCPRPDVVLVPSPPPTLGAVGVVIAALRRSRLVYVVQDLYPEVAVATGAVQMTLPLRLLARLMAWVYRRSAAVIVIDEQFIEAIRIAEPRAYAVAIRNAIDRTPFEGASRSEAFLREVGVEEGRPVVMYAGNVGRSQDLHAVIEATAAVGAEFVVHGQGAGLAALEAAVRAERWHHVHFSGYRPREELGTVFASADLHVVPLKPGIANASVPSKLLSIFSAGRPAVVTAEPNSAAARVVEESGGGWVVRPGDIGALVEALRVVHDQDELVTRGEGARRWSEHGANPERCAAEYEAVLTAATRDEPHRGDA